MTMDDYFNSPESKPPLRSILTLPRSHWFAFLFWLPFPVMIWLHGLLGLSDALMVATPPGDTEAHTFNLVMVLVGYGGAGIFLAHGVALWDRGWHWVVLKCLFILVYWTLIISSA